MKKVMVDGFRVGDLVRSKRDPNRVGVIREFFEQSTYPYRSVVMVEFGVTDPWAGHGGLRPDNTCFRPGSKMFWNHYPADLEFTDPFLRTPPVVKLTVEDFPVGALVRMKEDYEPNRGPKRSLIGVVRRISEAAPRKVGVEWSSPVIDGNRMNGTAKEGRGFYVRPDQLELL